MGGAFGGKKAERARGEASMPSWFSISASEAEVMVPEFAVSRTSKDSRMLRRRGGGMWL